MKTAITILTLSLLTIVPAMAGSHSSGSHSSSSRSETRPRIGHHGGMNGPSHAGWGNGGGNHH